VVCKDKAGNEAEDKTKSPVNVDLARPGVSGVDVAPGKDGLGPNPTDDGGEARRKSFPPITVSGGKD
jgi:hypothetical protein